MVQHPCMYISKLLIALLPISASHIELFTQRTGFWLCKSVLCLCVSVSVKCLRALRSFIKHTSRLLRGKACRHFTTRTGVSDKLIHNLQPTATNSHYGDPVEPIRALATGPIRVQMTGHQCQTTESTANDGWRKRKGE